MRVGYLAAQIKRTALRLPDVVQAGNPVLRQKATELTPFELQNPETQKLIDRLKRVMQLYRGYGLAAPQLGVAKRIFVMESEERGCGFIMQVNEEQIKAVPSNLAEVRKIKTFPLQVFVNPVMTITNKKSIALREGCLSVKGYSARVKRAMGVRVDALDERGEPFTIEATGWTARIIQHEMDHLDGNLYVDGMDSRSLYANEELHHVLKSEDQGGW